MKRIFILTVVFVLATAMLITFSLSGCKTETTTETTAAETTVEETTAAETTATETTAAQKGGEVVMTVPDPVPTFLEPFVKEFTEETGIAVRIESVPGSGPELVAKYASYWASETSPYDLVGTPDEGITAFLGSGWLLPLNDIIPQETFDDFTASMKERMAIWDTKDGNILRIPYNSELQYWYVRQDVLTEKGLEAPTTWDEMIAVGEELKKSNMWVTGDALMKPGYPFVYISYLAAQAGGDIFAFDEGTAEAFKFIYDMINTYEVFPKDALNWTYSELNAAYLNDELAMIRQWPYVYDVVRADTEWFKEDKAVIMLPPKGPVNNKSWLGLWGWSISKFAPNMDNAKTLITWITSSDVQSRMAVAFGHFLVARNSVLEAAGDQGLAPYLKMYDDAGAIGPRPFHTKLAEAQNAVDETLQAYLLGQTTLEEAMINGKALIEALGPRE